jgi:hypothetical protein
MRPDFECAESHLAVLQEAGRILAGTASDDAARGQIVECLCTGLHWEYGARGRPDALPVRAITSAYLCRRTLLQSLSGDKASKSSDELRFEPH